MGARNVTSQCIFCYSVAKVIQSALCVRYSEDLIAKTVYELESSVVETVLMVSKHHNHLQSHHINGIFPYVFDTLLCRTGVSSIKPLLHKHSSIFVQVTALKGQIRQLAEAKDVESKTSADHLKQKLHEVTQKASRTESIARSARANASKSQAECQVCVYLFSFFWQEPSFVLWSKFTSM